MVDRCALGERLQDRANRSRLPVKHPPERVVCDEPSGSVPVAGRDCVPHCVDDISVVGEPPRGPPVQVRNLIG
jgi:hypothetical protein